MKRGKPMKRTPFRRKRTPESAARAQDRFERQFGGDAVRERIVKSGCCMCGTRSRKIDAAHLLTRGAGNGLEVNVNPDRLEMVTGNVIPLCRKCHRAQSRGAWADAQWERAWEIATELYALLHAEGYLPLRECSTCCHRVIARRFLPFDDGGICITCDETRSREAVAS